MDRIRAFHVNDCRKDLGSRVDRHAHIGQGFIGLEAFRLLVNDRRFAQIPKILETPKGPDLEEDRMNLASPPIELCNFTADRRQFPEEISKTNSPQRRRAAEIKIYISLCLGGDQDFWD